MTFEMHESIAVAGFVGLLSGTHTAIWGMYKDAVHEGFAATRFSRSMIVGAVAAAALQAWLRLDLRSPGSLVLLFGLAYAAERGIVEVWKTFVRDEDQSKYFIPMQFSVRGVPVTNRWIRVAVGAGYVAAVTACLFAISLQDAGGRASGVRAAIVGLVVGAIVAIGGGWKDAPKEGFDLLKFFRSPAMTVIYAVLLSWLTDSYLLIAAAAIGFERATAETYKTFFFPAKPRGKFSGKPILYPHMLARRVHFVPAYVAISATVLVCITIAL